MSAATDTIRDYLAEIEARPSTGPLAEARKQGALDALAHVHTLIVIAERPQRPQRPTRNKARLRGSGAPKRAWPPEWL